MSKRIRHPKKTQSGFQGPITDLKLGECIVVKPGVKDPDYGIDIGGLARRVSEKAFLPPRHGAIPLPLESHSLRRMPAYAHRRGGAQGGEWESVGV